MKTAPTNRKRTHVYTQQNITESHDVDSHVNLTLWARSLTSSSYPLQP